MIKVVKKIVVFFLILVLTGCSQKVEYTETVIEYNSNAMIAINYPITHIKKIDDVISNYIDRTYKSFKKDYERNQGNIAELNIDYTYDVINNYINISLTTFISTNTLTHPINEIYTVVYDKKKNKLVNVRDLLSPEELDKLLPKIKQDLITKYKECIYVDLLDSKINSALADYELFILNNNGITLYFNPYEISSGNCNIINTNIPLNISFEDKEMQTFMLPDIIEYDPTKPTIALTFDDGPSRYTKKIIELLKEYEAVGTFFVIGNKVDIYKETIALMYKNGNEIGNHSYNHKWLTRLTDEEFFSQIEDTQKVIKKITNYSPVLLRPTYGSINNRIRKNSSLDIVMWDVDTNDWRLKNYKTIAYKALKNIQDGDIVLMHDIYERTYKALEIILPKLKEEGYQFVTVSELKKINELKNTQR